MTVTAIAIDTSWHPPAATAITNLEDVLNSSGVFGFIFDSSKTPPELYGRYNYCNMPHVRRREYPRASEEYELVYVEIVRRAFSQTI
jgi:hypothetical protein